MTKSFSLILIFSGIILLYVLSYIIPDAKNVKQEYFDTLVTVLAYLSIFGGVIKLTSDLDDEK